MFVSRKTTIIPWYERFFNKVIYFFKKITYACTMDKRNDKK